jgi:hypothetical protein
MEAAAAGVWKDALQQKEGERPIVRASARIKKVPVLQTSAYFKFQPSFSQLTCAWPTGEPPSKTRFASKARSCDQASAQPIWV